MTTLEIDLDDETAARARANAAMRGVTLEQALVRAAKRIAETEPRILREDPHNREEVMRILRTSTADFGEDVKFDREALHDRDCG